MTSGQAQYARIVVATDGTWRAEQLAQFLYAIDGVASRLTFAAHLAQLLRDTDWVIANQRALGLLDKGRPKDWGETPGGVDALSRSDYLKWTAALRQYGIRVRETDFSWSLEFEFDDILAIVPRFNRLEVESIRMSSPGWITALLGTMATKPSEFLLTLRHFVDSIIWRPQTKEIMEAAVRVAKADALERELQVFERVLSIRSRYTNDTSCPEGTAASTEGDAANALAPADFPKSTDTLALSLRDAGLPMPQIQKRVLEHVQADANVIYRLAAEGRIRLITVGPPLGEANQASKPPKGKPPKG